MEEIARRPLGSTGLLVSEICLGTSPLASMPEVYGYEVDDARAEATIEAALAGPLNFIDTSNNYGGGSAETRIGRVLQRHGGLPEGVVLATKVDADQATRDFSGDRVKRSAEESLSRLGLDRIQLMYLHDPEAYLTFDEAMAPGGAVAALVGLRDSGVVGHIGVEAGDVPLMRQLVATDLFEVVLNHNRYTLVDRSAEPLIDDAIARGVAFVNAAPYGGGILSKGPGTRSTYGYRDADGVVLERVRLMQAACERHGVPLAAAALQFSLREPRVTSTVVGVSSPGRIAETVALAQLSLPDELWDELADLTPPSEHWLT
jgi:D-threo-aldose 1-dehydrogenase